MEGNLHFKMYLPSLLCLTLYLREIFQVQALRALIFGRAYFQNFTLFVENCIPFCFVQISGSC